MDFRNCSKSAKEDCSYRPLFSSLYFSSLRYSFLAYFERLWQRAMELQSLVLHEFELSIAFPWIPNNSPQSRIALVIKKAMKTPMITTQKVLFYTFNSLCFKHFCVVVLHIYSNWHVKDLAMTSNHICG